MRILRKSVGKTAAGIVEASCTRPITRASPAGWRRRKVVRAIAIVSAAPRRAVASATPHRAGLCPHPQIHNHRLLRGAAGVHHAGEHGYQVSKSGTTVCRRPEESATEHAHDAEQVELAPFGCEAHLRRVKFALRRRRDSLQRTSWSEAELPFFPVRFEDPLTGAILTS